MNRHTFLSDSPTATLNFGRRVGRMLKAGSILALIGELGSGKTLFTKGICAGLDVPSRYVTSPTFVLVNEYRGKLPVFHMDLYRIDGIADGFEIGVLDYLAKAGTGIIVVEWAEKILSLLPDDYIKVEFHVLSAKKRQLVLSGCGEKLSSLLRKLGEQ